MATILRRRRNPRVPVVAEGDEHPERLAVLAHAPAGRVLEVGCGSRKTDARYVAVDLTPGGRPGRFGNVKGKISQADVAGDGRALPFADRAFSGLVARHNLEHYVDIAGTLLEWRRVVRTGGVLVVIVPDEARFPGSTLALDPTHYHAFDEPGLINLLSCTGWRPRLVEPCVLGWSLLGVADRA